MANENETVVFGQEILDALRSITREAKDVQKTEGIDFRFIETCVRKNVEDVKKRVEQLKHNLSEHDIRVDFFENLDIKDTSKGGKYSFRIQDINGNFIDVDTLEYRKITLDYGHKEIDYIVDKLIKLLGLKSYDKVIKISKYIVELVSFVYYYEKFQCKIYDDIGWDRYNGEMIFKYDKIYTQSRIEVESQCTNSIAGELFCGNDSLADEWKEYAIKLMNESVEARIVLASACTGLVRSILTYNKETNINMNIQGYPGSGKSSLCQFALSIFGNPSALEGSFIDTDNAMEIIRVKRPVIPYILDDRLLKIENTSEKGKSRALLFEVFREYEGKVTERLGGAYKDISGQRTNAPIISSSVESMMDILLKSGSDLGQYRRFIEIKLDKQKIFNNDAMVVEKYRDLACKKYGIGVKYIVCYIMDMGSDAVNKLYEQNLEYISTKLDMKGKQVGIGGLSASASRFALIATTYIIINKAFHREKLNIEGTLDFGERLKKTEEMNVDAYYQYLAESIEEELVDFDLYDDILWASRGKLYEELVDYLIDNLVEKMQRVSIKVDVYNNLVTFFMNKSNEKWFDKTTMTQFFDDKKREKIAFVENISNNKFKLWFRGKRYIEWLMCGDVDLEEEQIKKYLNEVVRLSLKKENAKIVELAEDLFGKQTVGIDFASQLKDNQYIRYQEEERVANEQNPVTITLEIPTISETSEEDEQCS